MDPLFRVELIAATPSPQRCIYAAMHQDYSEDFVYDQRDSWPDEDKAGEIIVKRLLSGGRGHYGPLEQQQIVLNFGWFPHSVMQQARTHRIGVSFDCQSMRYTGKRIVAAAKSEVPIESVFYVRPAGTYQDRHGAKYEYSETERRYHLACCMDAANRYAAQVERGMAEEHARGLIPFDVRQHFVASFTLRAALHFMDLRAKRDAQDEIRQMAQLMWPHIKAWVPAVAEWYEQARLGKAMLAP